MIEYPKGGILSKEIFKGENVDITLFCMSGKTEISEHTSTREGFVFVLEGKGIFNLEGKDIPMLSGTFIRLRANAVHSIKTEENTSFILSLF